jgi:hypothetical protein
MKLVHHSDIDSMEKHHVRYQLKVIFFYSKLAEKLFTHVIFLPDILLPLYLITKIEFLNFGRQSFTFSSPCFISKMPWN